MRLPGGWVPGQHAVASPRPATRRCGPAWAARQGARAEVPSSGLTWARGWTSVIPMRAMILTRPGEPLQEVEWPEPVPGPGEIRLRVAACGVCRTDLHVADGELPDPALPLVLGHEIVGRVDAVGDGVTRFRPGDRVGVPWLGWTCGLCAYCRSGRENLCPHARFTGYHRDGGYAEAAVADARFAFPIPESHGDADAAPLLCAGLIGHRAWAPVHAAPRLGLYGFGA